MLVGCTRRALVVITCLVVVMYVVASYYVSFYHYIYIGFCYLFIRISFYFAVLQVGGSSFSSLYSSRGMGGSSYMGGSGSGSYY